MKAWLLLLIMLPFWTNLLIRTYRPDGGVAHRGLRQHGAGAGCGMASSHVMPAPSSAIRSGAFQPLPLLHNNFAVVFGLVYVQLPFMVLPLYAALDRLDRSLLEASLDLGAGHMATFGQGGGSARHTRASSPACW